MDDLSEEEDELIKQSYDKIDTSRYHGLFRGYTRNNYHLGELRATWAELFNDLIFVAIIVHLAYEAIHSLPPSTSSDNHYETSVDEYAESHRRLAESDLYMPSRCGQYDYLFVVFAQFGLFCTFWTEQVMYQSHFIFHQLHDEVIRVLYMVIIIAMGVFIGNHHSYHIAFLACYGILRFLSLFMYFKALLIPRAKKHALWHIYLYLCVMVIIFWIIFAMTNDSIYSDCPMAYFAIYCVLFFIEYIGRGARLLFLKKDNVHHNVPHVAERYGLFVMIILGESLISLMTADIGKLDVDIHTISGKDFWIRHNTKNTDSDLMQVALLLLVFVNSYLIGRLYYDCQPTEECILENEEQHALGRKNKIYAKIYSAVHQILFFGLFGYGVGIKLVTKHIQHDEHKLIDVLLPGYSLFVIVISLNIIRIIHPFDGERPKWVWIQRIVIICVMGILPLAAFIDVNQGIIFGLMFWGILMLVVVDIEGHHKQKEERKMVENTRRYSSKFSFGLYK